MEWQIVKDWLFDLGAQYGVNPILFGSLYLGSTPLLTLSLAWLIRNWQQRRSIVLPIVSATLFFVATYLYLLIAGDDLPLWIYLFVAASVGSSLILVVRKIQRQLQEEEGGGDP